MASAVLGIDLGTQSIKIIVYEPYKKKVIHSGSALLELDSRSDGSREQLAEWWVEGFLDCVDSIPSEIKKTIRAIGVSGQQHGFVPVDENGQVLAPVKLWCDTSTDKECKDILAEIGGEKQCQNMSGSVIKTGYTISKIRWLRDHQPDVYARMDKILLPHDYLNFYLTGKYCMECGDASGTGLLDIRDRSLCPELIKILDPERDLSSCFPELIEAYASVGKLRPALARELGFPADVIVSAGGGDNMMAAIGTGNVVQGKLTASLGSSGTLFAFCNKPMIDPMDELAAFCSSSGGWLPLLCTMNCTIATENIRDLLNLQLRDIDSLAKSSPIGAEGVLSLPFFNGERVPDLPNGKAVIAGLDQNNFTNANLLRSAMESAIFAIKNGLQAFARNGLTFDEVTLTGGGSQSELWRQICADILDLPVKVLHQDENAAFGAALQALWCLSCHEQTPITIEEICKQHLSYDESKSCYPDSSAVIKYKNIYQSYITLIDTITPLYKH